ncbi:thiamine biosynthesis protein ApbE [Burkholderia sp. SRS-W-2-2016]|uniref:FAD:protein FMN transferase n=1 Tax=Burkholderia sp. SRS-W-2-2016 TaxID=1926878 RepID=UPI00094B3E72|nr:FAD:protein FMN transferase [Burkholderia sp. SRS-W-2-2016]OLL32620.1 thiamine biosynthesis protein ApbE [Burkholderia sp. SRS-W-2-2016]
MNHSSSSHDARAAEADLPARRVLVPAGIDGGALAPVRGGRVASFGGDTMGTSWSVRCVLPADDAVQRESGALAGASADSLETTLDTVIRRVLDDVIAQMSNWRDDSDVSRFNRAAAGSWVSVPPACFDVVEAALAVARDSGGAYDPSAGPLVDLWGFGPAPRAADSPSVELIEAARARCGWQRVAIERADLRLYQPGAIALDLCAIAKGYAVDAVRDALLAHGIAHLLVEIGGELRGDGVKPDGLPWWVELETPPLDHADHAHDTTITAPEAPPPTIDLIALHGLAVATSGDYRRYYFDAGVRRAHTLDPRTGYPANHALASVTVLHPSCMLADAWSTALSVLGPDAGLALAQRKRLAARFIVRTSTGFRELASPAYKALLE